MASAIRFVVPAWTNVKGVYEAIGGKVKKEQIVGIQNYGSGRYEVLLTDGALCEALLEDGVIINDRKVQVNIYKDPRKWIRVFGLPLLEKDNDVRDALSRYGEITNIRHETYEWNASLKTGVRRVLMTVTSDLPDLIIISGTKCRLQGPGVKKVCFDCLQHGHFKENCPGILKSTPEPENLKRNAQNKNFECSIDSIHPEAGKESAKEKQMQKDLSGSNKEVKKADSKKEEKVEEKIERIVEKKEMYKERREVADEGRGKVEERKKKRNCNETSGSNEESVLDRMSDQSTSSFLDRLHGLKDEHKKQNKEQQWRKPSKKERKQAERDSFHYWSQGW